MKKIILSLAAITANIGFADSAIPEITTPPLPRVELVPVKQNRYLYFVFTAGQNDLSQAQNIAPGLGIGIRQFAGNGAIDVAITGIGTQQNKNSSFACCLPKATYLHYFSPEEEQSMYFGGGLSWAGIYSHRRSHNFTKDADFWGIMPHLALGYEFARTGYLGFAEINFSQPAIPVIRKVSETTFKPRAEAAIGFGF